MKRLSFFLLACFLGISCEEIIPIGPDPETPDTETPADTPVIEPQALFMSCIWFPKDYDWFTSKNPKAECHLCMRTPGKELYKSVNNEEFHVSEDWDQHKIKDGNLYDYWTDDSGTVVRKNGTVLFTFPGTELTIDFFIYKNDIYTINTPQVGGYILRKNGEVFSQSSEMQPISRLHEDNGELCMGVYHTDEKGNTRIALVVNGVMDDICNLDKDVSILEYLRVDGIPTALVQKGAYTNVLYKSNGKWEEKSFGRATAHRMHIDGESVLVDCSTSSQYLTYRFTPASEKNETVFSHPALAITDFTSMVVDGKIVILSKNPSVGLYQLHVDDEKMMLPEGYRPVNTYAMAFFEDKLYVSVLDKKNHAFLWVDGEIVDMEMNGYISQLAVCNITKSDYATDLR